MIQINQTKAIEVAKQKVRAVRDPLLAQQDIEFQKALEVGADTTAIVAEKQRLRDLPAVCDTATTVDELQVILTDLGA